MTAGVVYSREMSVGVAESSVCWSSPDSVQLDRSMMKIGSRR